MFFSLIQTLVCVLLVNGGLYALHLTGNGGGPNSNNNNVAGGSSSSSNSQGSSSGGGGGHSSSHLSSNSNQMKNPANNPFQASTNRLNEELADLAQRERERLMVIGLAKQTAEESGYHGRPVITGRIKMHPVDDMDSDYSNWLNQQARNVMFGSVVKQPSLPAMTEEDYEDEELGYEPLRRPTKYEYGRVVQPVEREFENPHTLNLDDFAEMEAVNEEEDVFPDLDGYAYLEDLMAEENKERLRNQQAAAAAAAHHQNVPQFPGFRQQQHHSNPYGHSYQTQEHLEALPQTLQEFLEKEQKQHATQAQHHLQQQQLQLQQQQQQHQFNQKYHNNIRMQQKWQRKRAQVQQQQQQMQLKRNIFGQKQKPPQQQQQQHYFKTQSSNKLSLANSEATATSKVNNNNNNKNLHNPQINELPSAADKSGGQQQQQQQGNNDKTNDLNKSEKSSKTVVVSAVGEQQKPEQLMHPNHKRSGGGGGGGSGSTGGLSSSAAAVASVTSPHSLANQLMLRSARGQRQYDVPQIECPTAMDGMERFACPTPDVQGRYRCIDDHVLCDGFIDCPEGEDEDRRSCMFYKTTKAHLDVLADALLRWARG